MNILEQIIVMGSEAGLSTEPVRVLGVDLGTTNSTVAEIVYDPNQPKATSVRCLAVEQAVGNRSWWNPLVPSVVALHEGKEIVGEGARRLRARWREAGLIDNGNFFAGCKNDMGLRRTYHMAPGGYRSAAEIGGRVLAFLRQAALKDKPLVPLRTTVTVPASFQAAQRQDTLKAAKLGGLSLQGGDLLDEPVAAFLGYLGLHPDQKLLNPGESKNLLVFDFGGGTCDVAILRLGRDPLTERLTVASLAVSRYHRLGGGDIDQAIVYEVLLPQLLEQNQLNRRQIDFDAKKYIIEPAFLGLAEELKAGLCERMLPALYEGEDCSDMIQAAAGEYTCALADGRRLLLTNPQLTAAAFAELLAPFLDTELLCLRETEYRQTLSIFAPIDDALERCELASDEIDLCLLAGGSCLIPQVVEAMCDYFDNAEILTFDNADHTQTAIAHGAALNALSLALCGQPIIQPVCQETIAIVTSNGPFDLIPRGATLPWPPDGGFAAATTLAMPQDSTGTPVPIRVEVVARESLGQRTIFREGWQVPPPVRKGDRIRLEYRYDENQALEIRMAPADHDGTATPFRQVREHPLTHLVNPQEVKLRIEETEEQLRAGMIPPDEQQEAIRSIARDCAKLRHYEKAIARLSDLMRRRNVPDSGIINQVAMYCGYMKDFEREEELYHEAIKVDPEGSTPWFNLALLLRQQERLDEAKEAIDQAIALGANTGPYYVLQAKIVKEMGKDFATAEFLAIGLKRFPPLNEQSDWELHWFQSAAEMREDQTTMEAVRRERHERGSKRQGNRYAEDGILPDLALGQLLTV
jgi:molecular chaperone DnaK (HSP70)